MKFAKETLQQILDYVEANGNAVATPEKGGEEGARILRAALYKRIARQGLRGIRITIEQGSVVLERLELVGVTLEGPGDDA